MEAQSLDDVVYFGLFRHDLGEATMDDHSEVNPPNPPEPEATSGQPASRAQPKKKREELPSLTHWQHTENGIPQRFYIGFCLYMSAVQDALLGQMERARSNLNWSATCSYYGLVHGGRLLCFLALGDFPTRHNELRDLLWPVHHPRRGGNNAPDERRFCFDWLRRFARDVAHRPDPNTDADRADLKPTKSQYRDMIVEYFERIRVGDFRARLDQFGKTLRAAAELRNDSNYEALLIAHEYDHFVMTRAFGSLAELLASATDNTLPFLTDVFSKFIDEDSDLALDRDGYRAFLHAYWERRVRPALGRKLEGFDNLKNRLCELKSRFSPATPAADFERLEGAVSYDLFGPKAQLMTDFESRMDELRRAVEDR